METQLEQIEEHIVSALENIKIKYPEQRYITGELEEALEKIRQLVNNGHPGY